MPIIKTLAVLLDHKFYILWQRVNQCLQNACAASNIPSCKIFRDCGRDIDFGGQNGQIRQQWYNDSASTACFNTGDDATFQYGIYQQAVLLATKRSAVTRYIYSLFWGFQVFYIIAHVLLFHLGIPFVALDVWWTDCSTRIFLIFIFLFYIGSTDQWCSHLFVHVLI